jgi:hypothetical protein
MESSKLAAAGLAALSIAIVIFQISSFVTSVISGQMVIKGVDGWLIALSYHLGLPIYVSWIAIYLAYPGTTGVMSRVMGLNALAFMLVSGIVVFGITIYFGAFSLSVMVGSIFYGMIVGWIAKALAPAVNQDQLVGYIIFFFFAEFFYVFGRNILLSDYVLGDLKATMSGEMRGAKPMSGRAAAFLIAASLAISFAKVVVTLLYLSFLFGNAVRMDFASSIPTAVIAFIFTVVPVTAATMILGAMKNWLSENLKDGAYTNGKYTFTLFWKPKKEQN